MTSSTPDRSYWFAPLFRVTRPGSRTILCDPEEAEPVLAFARRGYRLLLLNSVPTDLRTQLREAGLSSQLMGSYQYGEGRLSLAKAFYELLIFCGEPPFEASQIEPYLRPQAMVLWRQGVFEPIRSFEELELPNGLSGVRYL